MKSSDRYTFINFIDLSNDQKREVLKWRNDPLIKKWMYNKDIITDKEHFLFIASLAKSQDRKYFLIKKGEMNVGVFSLTNFKKLEGELGYYLNPELILGNLSVECYHHILLFCFNTLSVEKLYGYVEVGNRSASSINKLFGFNSPQKETIYKMGNEYNFIELEKKHWATNIENNTLLKKILTLTKERNE